MATNMGATASSVCPGVSVSFKDSIVSFRHLKYIWASFEFLIETLQNIFQLTDRSLCFEKAQRKSEGGRLPRVTGLIYWELPYPIEMSYCSCRSNSRMSCCNVAIALPWKWIQKNSKKSICLQYNLETLLA